MRTGLGCESRSTCLVEHRADSRRSTDKQKTPCNVRSNNEHWIDPAASESRLHRIEQTNLDNDRKLRDDDRPELSNELLQIRSLLIGQIISDVEPACCNQQNAVEQTMDDGDACNKEEETIDHNCECFKKQMERFIEFGEDKAIMVNNADWLLNLNYIELLREVGACFSVNNMLRAECYKQRMEKGLSFLEFNYMIMQAYDFYHLHQKYGCNMQFGGDDQWSNMLAGTELIRKKTGEDAYAMTITLLLNSEGKKMGKTAKGAVWLDPNKTSPFDFYQYWRNVDDADVMKCIKMLTFIPMEEINEIEHWEDNRINEKKELLAYHLTELVHGKEEADKAQAAAKALFGGSGDSENMPSIELSDNDFEENGIGIVQLVVKCGFAQSNGEAKRLIQQGGVSVNDKTVEMANRYNKTDFETNFIVKKGKKHFCKVIYK